MVNNKHELDNDEVCDGVDNAHNEDDCNAIIMNMMTLVITNISRTMMTTISMTMTTMTRPTLSVQ